MIKSLGLIENDLYIKGENPFDDSGDRASNLTTPATKKHLIATAVVVVLASIAVVVFRKRKARR